MPYPRYYDERQRWRIMQRLFQMPGGAEIALVLAARFGRRLAARDIRRARRYGRQ
jgi:predicted membrane metal-binding protein